MKHNEKYVVDEFEDKVVLFDTEEETLITLNSSAMYMWKNCEGDEEQIVDRFLAVVDKSKMSEEDLIAARCECIEIIRNMKEKKVLIDE